MKSKIFPPVTGLDFHCCYFRSTNSVFRSTPQIDGRSIFSEEKDETFSIYRSYFTYGVHCVVRNYYAVLNVNTHSSQWLSLECIQKREREENKCDEIEKKGYYLLLRLRLCLFFAANGIRMEIGGVTIQRAIMKLLFIKNLN